jgi:single-strand DNA-binding protein
MAKSVNSVTLMGNLTRDPELRTTTSGSNVTNFSLALNSSYKEKDSDEWKEKTDYIDCVAWSKTGETVDKFFNKGSRILVQGHLQSRNWEQDGQKRSKVEVVVTDVFFVDSKKQEALNVETPVVKEPEKPAKVALEPDEEPIDLKDIPF